MPNEYDSILEKELGPASTGTNLVPTTESANDYDGVIAGMDNMRKQSLQQATFVATQTDPERAAKVKQISDRTKVPTAIVERNFDVFNQEQQRVALDYDSILRDTPATGEWLSNPENAKVAIDDANGLGNIERTMAKHSTLYEMYRALDSGSATFLSSIAKAPGFGVDTLNYATNKTLGAAGIESKADYLPKGARKNAFTEYLDTYAKSQAPEELSQSEWELVKNMDIAGLGRTAAIKLAANVPNLVGLMLMYGAGAAAATAAGGLAVVGGPVVVGGLVAGAGMAALSGASKYGENMDAGVEQETAIESGLLHGGFEAAGEGVGTIPFLGQLGKSLVKNVGVTTAREILKEAGKTLFWGFANEGKEELVTELGQSVADYSLGIDPKALDNIAPKLFDAFVGGGTVGLGLGTPGSIMVAAKRVKDAREAGLARDFYTSLGDSAEATKLRQRLPEAQRDFVEKLVKDSPVENIYVAPQALEVLFQGENPVQKMQEIGVLENYAQAKEAGTDVKIPLATWVNSVPPELYKKLADDIKFDPSASSVNELKVERERVTKILEQAQKEAQAAQGQGLIELSDERLKTPNFWDNEQNVRSVIQTAQQAEHLESQLLDANIAANEAVQAGDTSTQQRTIIGDTKKGLEAIAKIKGSLPSQPTQSVQAQREQDQLQAKAIGNRIGDQLQAAGQNKEAAVALEGFFKALSSKFRNDGVDLSPEQLFAQYPLSIQPSGAQAPQQGQVLNQPGDYEQLPVQVDNEDGNFSIETEAGKASGTMMGGNYGWWLAADGSDAPKKKSLQKLADKYNNVWNVEHIEVDPSERGKGVGAQMLDSIIRAAAENDSDAILLNASPLGENRGSLADLIEFYKSRGFKVVDQYKDQNAIMVLDMKKAPKTLFQSQASQSGQVLNQDKKAELAAQGYQFQTTDFKGPNGKAELEALAALNPGAGVYVTNGNKESKFIDLDAEGVAEISKALDKGERLELDNVELAIAPDGSIAGVVISERGRVRHSFVSPNERRKGIASALYDRVQSRFGVVEGSDTQSEDAKAFWAARGQTLNQSATLDMSEEARMARAKEMGFDISRTYYHGGTDGYEEFKTNPKGANKFLEGVYFTPNKNDASRYSDMASGQRGGGKLYEVYVRGKLLDLDNVENIPAVLKELGLPHAKVATKWPFNPEMKTLMTLRLAVEKSGVKGKEVDRALKEKLQAAGYSGVKTENDQVVSVFDPKDVRSVDAAFDPAETDSTKILNQSAPAPAKPFYSKMAKLIDEKMGTSATVQQIQGLIKDIKPEERKWSGIDEFLAGKEKVSKAELQEFLAANELQIEEIEKGGQEADVEKDEYQILEQEDGTFDVLTWAGTTVETGFADFESADEYLDGLVEKEFKPTKFSKYTLPGGSNYREVLFTLPPRASAETFPFTIEKHPKFDTWIVKWEKGGQEGGFASEELAKLHAERQSKETREALAENYNSSHWDEANVLAHVRLNDRTDADGKKVLFVEEIQSDWHQAGRKQGYKGDQAAKTVTEYQVTIDGEEVGPAFSTKEEAERAMTARQRLEMNQGKKVEVKEVQAVYDKSQSGVPDAPFRKTWHEFALKRIIRMAAEGGYDRVAWTTGEQQAERYDIGKKVDEIVYEKLSDLDGGTYSLRVIDKHGDRVNLPKQLFTAQELPGIVGKEVAEKITKGEGKKSPNNVRPKSYGIEPSGTSTGLWHVFEMGKDDGYYSDGLSQEGAKALAAQKNAESKSDAAQSTRSIKGLDLKIGGEGMKGFYDKILVDFANKFGKKYGAKVSRAEVKTGKDLFTSQLVYEGPEVTSDQVRALIKGAETVSLEETLRDVAEGLDAGMSTAEAMRQYGSIAAAKAVGGDADWSGLETGAAHAMDITPELRTAALNEGFSLFQSGPTDPRGQIALMPNEAIISLGKAADPSTFFHETGHYFFEFLTRLNENEATPQTVKDDYATLLQWLEVKPGEAPNTEQLEKFARGFEAYVMEGKAPSNKLKKAFATFRIWLTSVYRSIKGLNVELTPAVRGVMDRLLATEDEITEAAATNNFNPMFEGEQGDFGFKGKKLERYQKAVFEARRFAEEQLTNALMEDLKKTQRAEYKAKREEVENEMRSQVAKQPEQRALAALQKGTTPDGKSLPEGTPALKLDPKSVAVTLDANGTPDLKLPRGITAKSGGFPVAIVAEGFGFQSPEQFLVTLSNTKPYEAAVQEATENMMRALYPDLMGTPQVSEEAVKALHNEARSEMLQLELEHLMENAPGVARDVVRRTVRRPPTIKEVRQQASAMIGKQVVRDIRPAMYQRAEVKAARDAAEALVKGDLEAASQAKQRELLNHELYRAATLARTELAKGKEDFKKYFRKNDDLAKTRDMDLVNAGRAILAQYGVGKTDKSAADYLEPMKSYDPDTYQTMLSLVQAATEKSGNYEEITYDDFSAMKLALDAIWELSKNIRTLEVDGQKVQQQKAIDAMKLNLSERMAVGEKQGYDKSLDKWGKTKRMLLGLRSMLTRTESWVKVMDKGDQGAFHDYLFNPISQATTKYRLEKVKFLKKYLALTQGLKNVTQERILAPELGPRGFEFQNKAQLLGMLLHTGNNSNKSKLLRGYGWGTVNEDGTLNSDKFDEFIARAQREGILTKADYDFVQGVWDLFEEMKPMAQKAHKDMYGFYFDEVTADEFTTPFGVYRGGYAPAKVDPYANEDASVRAEKELLERSNNSFAFPTAGRGATKTRIDAYAAPLQMDLSLVGSHIDWALRFSTIEPAVKAASKMLWNKDFQQALYALDPTVRSELLIPWLQRAAQQQIETPSKGVGGRGLDNFFRYIRRNSSLNIMVFNVVNTIEQFTGISVAAVKVKPAYLRNALWNYMRNPKDSAEAVNEKSEYMRSRLSKGAHEVMSAIEEILIEPSKYDKAIDFANKHGYILQRGTQNVVDLAVWMGAYDQAVARGAGEVEAVKEADSIVRQTQGSGAAEDVSRVETGTAFVRLFTTFWGYFNMMGNLLGSEFANIPREMGLKKAAGRGLYIYTMGFMVPAILSALLRKAAGGSLDEDDDDEYLDDAMDVFFNGQFRLALALLPGAGQVIQTGFNAFNNKWYDDRVNLSPAVAAVEGVVRTPHSVYQAMFEDGSKKRAVRDFLSAVGTLTGIPASAASRPVGYLIDVQEGNANPKGVIDFTRGLVTGRPGTP